MGKVRRGNYVFITWKGDHDPKHVHVFKDKKPLGKWDLENDMVMEGKIGARVRKLIEQLKKENAI